MQLTADIADRLSNSLKHVAGLEGSGKLAVAVSGGGDSTALMTMLKPWCSERGLELRAVSVNHGLRKGKRDGMRVCGFTRFTLGNSARCVVV